MNNINKFAKPTKGNINTNVFHSYSLPSVSIIEKVRKYE